jgi:GPH family glycoside/pentoside/hexuronide:cation symporter
MAISLAVISIIPIYVGFPFLFERKDLATDTSYPFLKALKLTFMNRSYLTAAGAQAMRFVATGILQMGMPFYTKIQP